MQNDNFDVFFFFFISNWIQMEVCNSKPGTRTNFFPFAHKLEVKMCAQKLVFSILIHCWLNQACEYFFQSRNSVFSLSLCHWLKCFSLSCVITVESYCANKITISHLVCKNAVSMPLNGRPEIYMPFSEFITKRNEIRLAQIFSPINIWQFPWNNSSPIISFYAEPNRHTIPGCCYRLCVTAAPQFPNGMSDRFLIPSICFLLLKLSDHKRLEILQVWRE